MESEEYLSYKPQKFRINSSDLRFTIDGIEYHWEGGFGSISPAANEELNGVKRGSSAASYAICGR